MPAPTLANSKCQAAYKPNGVISTRPHRLMMALMRLGLSTAVNFLPITAYDASQTTAANTSRLPSQACCAAPLSSPDATLCLARDNKPIPSAPQATASHTRTPMRSRRKIQLNKATTAGITDMMTPADTALVMLTPVIMQIENRKLPRNDSRNTSNFMRGANGASSAGFFSQRNIATAPMPKRNQASKNTGSASASGLVRAT